MPKVLNVVKLHKKFATLTKSKESVQSLAGWIMHHSEFHEDIVNEWLAGLSKDYSALVMFYVANEIIQNCGKKRVPEFREDFARVLKKAVYLEKVKIVKDNIIRLINFWRERDIYDENFSKELQSILNSKEIKVDSDDEPTEEEVIARFKKENLFEDLKKLQTAISDREEKEEMLKYADEPVKPESAVSLVQRECEDMIEKCEKYLKLVEETINLTCREVRVKKVLLEDLKDCCIFYSAQSRDVKDVANMFRIYGRKVKIMEKKITEKKTSLANTASNLSPSVPGDVLNSPNSVSSYASYSDNDNSMSVFERIFKKPQDSPELSSQEADNSEMQKSFFALLNPDKNAESNSLSEGSIPDQGIEKSEGAIKELDKDKPKPDLNDIDFLLDESYECKRGNPKPGLKRKPEIRLRLKEKRVCTENVRESSNFKPLITPFKITDGENNQVNISEKDLSLEMPMNSLKGNDSVLSESLSDKSKTALSNKLPNVKDGGSDGMMILESTSQNDQINELINKKVNDDGCILEAPKDQTDELKNKKVDDNECMMVLEAPLQKDQTSTLINKKVDEDESVRILETTLQNDKTVVNDDVPCKKIKDDSEMLLEDPLQQDKTALNIELSNEKADKDSLPMLQTTSTNTGLSSPDRSKEGFESTELDGKFSSTTQKELASDSVPIKNKPDDPVSNTGPHQPKLSFENCLVSAETPQCSETLNQTKRDSSVIPKIEKDELKGDTPNLLENLQKVLECICNNQFVDLKTNDSGNEPLENYIAIYGALCCPVKDFTETKVSKPLLADGSIIRHNEVVDMECETDEES